MRYLILLGTCAFLFGATTLSFAIGLTDADFEYLATQNIERSSIVVLNLSPREQARLHGIINFVLTPAARAKDVTEALEGFMEHHNWERLHPGELWDLPKRCIDHEVAARSC
jgi:hypothetical protein